MAIIDSTRERAQRASSTLFDGELAAGPTEDGGWRVRTTLRYVS